MERTPLPPRRLLIVEDEPRMRATLEDMVAMIGFETVGASTAEKALRILAEQSFPMALIDLNLPGMSGMDLFERIHQQHAAMSVVILTGFGDLAAAQRAIRYNVVDFLTKPCHLGDLEVALDRAWRRAPARRVVCETHHADATQSASPPLPAPPASPALEPKTCEKAGEISLDEVERQHILAMLERHGGNRRTTAEALGISVRTLYYRLADYDRQ
ncbi:MAG: DNA-binding response regulator [Phycisphaeraceae bacterium]|nr:DNA-binding response regulator [Phycisphaeraceae bacterium]